MSLVLEISKYQTTFELPKRIQYVDCSFLMSGEANSIRVCNSEPSEPSEGDIYFNSVDKELYIAMG